MPHHLGGFIAFSVATFGAAAFSAIRSGEPAAMILAGGLCQMGAAAANVIIFWAWLPKRDAPALLEDDLDDEQAQRGIASVNCRASPSLRR